MKLKMHMISQAVVLVFSMYACIHFMVSQEVGHVAKFIALVVFLVTLWLAFRRDTYLPFLGDAAFPKSLIPTEVSPKDANTEIRVPFDAKDGTRVIYWGAQPTNPRTVFPTPALAYGDYSNAGVAVIKNGEALLRFQCPSEYYVPTGKKIGRHVHYRLCCQMSGLLGPVETLWVKC
jgi:hypothetical protein